MRTFDEETIKKARTAVAETLHCDDKIRITEVVLAAMTVCLVTALEDHDQKAAERSWNQLE